MTDHQWSARWCDYFEADRAWLPAVVDGTTTVGTVRSAAAAELGVTAGIPLKLGLGDTSSAMLAAGLTPDDLMHTTGTTQVLAALVQSPTPSPRLVTRLFGTGNLYLQAAHNPVGGVALDWLRNLCFREQSEAEFYERTVPAASHRTTRVLLDPPFLGGDRLEIEAHRAAFRELTLAVILSTADNITIPVVVWSLWLGGGLGQASALAMVMLAMMTPMIALYWLFARRQGLVAS